MELTLMQLYTGLETSIKEVEYLSPQAYVEPFVKALPSKVRLNIKAKIADQLIGKDPSQLTFNRVCVEASLDTDEDEYTEVIGLAYAIDIKDPVWKLYRGYRDKNGHLNMLGDQCLLVNAIDQGSGFKNVSHGVTSLLSLPLDLKRFKDTLAKPIDKGSMSERLGHWVQYCMITNKDYESYKVKLSERAATKTFKSLILDQDSPWFNTEVLDNGLLFSAASDAVDDGKDILTHVEKSIMIKEMLSI